MLVFFCTNVLTICVTYGEPTERGFQPSLHPMQSFRNLTRRSSAVCGSNADWLATGRGEGRELRFFHSGIHKEGKKHDKTSKINKTQHEYF